MKLCVGIRFNEWINPAFFISFVGELLSQEFRELSRVGMTKFDMVLDFGGYKCTSYNRIVSAALEKCEDDDLLIILDCYEFKSEDVGLPLSKMSKKLLENQKSIVLYSSSKETIIGLGTRIQTYKEHKSPWFKIEYVEDGLMVKDASINFMEMMEAEGYQIIQLNNL